MQRATKDDPFKILEEDFHALIQKDPELALTEIRAEDVIEADDSVMTSESVMLTYDEILEEFRKQGNIFFQSINTLSSYRLFIADGADEIYRHMNQFTYIIEKNIRRSQRQLLIDSFLC